MQKTLLLGTLSVGLILGVVLFCAGNQYLATRHLPDINLNTIDGRKLDLLSLKGQPALVIFWATSCPQCVKELPQLITLYNELNPQGVQFVGIAMPYDPPNRVVNLAQDKNIPYPLALDIDANASKAFGNVQVTPTHFIIAPNGNIIDHGTGPMNADSLRTTFRQLLGSGETASIIFNKIKHALV